MNDQLKVSIVQSNLHWEDPIANRDQFSDKLIKLTGTTDLIVLPEMFTTGFSMNAENLAEEANGPTFQWMLEIAKNCESAITGSVIIAEGDHYYNRLLFVKPDGDYSFYDKRHTFTLAGEHEVYSTGKEKLIKDYMGWKICPLICYDLRFPVWARNKDDYEVLIYVANWPDKRVKAWDSLLKARAIENMSYCVGVNRVGLDGNDHKYSGHSAVYDVLGNLISTSNHEEEFIETVVLEKNHLVNNREHLQFLNDRDDFNLM